MIDRARLRDLGHATGVWPTGPANSITDVPGVRVAHLTLIEGDRTRTGATAIMPHGGNPFTDRVPAAFDALNGYGKFAGSTQIVELGEIETPILLTNTLAVGRGIEALIRWTLDQPDSTDATSINAVVGETNDSRLNDIRAARPTVDELRRTIDLAAAQPEHSPVAEGAVGAGTGTVSFGLKGGIGTSSRRVGDATVAVLVQSNFGGRLLVHGRDMSGTVASPDGSIILIVATDAALDARQLRRLARRSFGGLARTGAALSHGSGDYALAFSTHPARGRERMADANLSPLFEATIEAAEEAILNSLTMAVPMESVDPSTGEHRRVDALPLNGFRRPAGL